MKYYVFFSTENQKDIYFGDYTSERKAQEKRKFLLKNDPAVRSVLVEYRRCAD